MKPEAGNYQGDRYLLTSVKGCCFAIPSTGVLEISAASKPTKLPFVPVFIAGLVNVKGSVIPLLDLSSYIFDAATGDDRVFAIISSGDTHFALAIDAVLDEIAPLPDTIRKHVARAYPGDNTGLLQVCGEIDHNGEACAILAMEQFDKILNITEERKEGGGLLGKIDKQDTHQEVMSLLVFQSFSERFGFALDQIVEVIEVDTIIPVPGAPDCVQGITRIREDALLVLSFPALLGREHEEETALKLLVVVDRDNTFYGVDISAAVGIARFFKNNVKKSHNEHSQFANVVIDAQEQVTAIIDNRELIPDELHQRLKSLVPVTAAKTTEVIHYKRNLHIRVNGLSYAFPLDYVRLVSINNAIIKVNDASKFVSGVIEIEGRIISVLDPGRYLGAMDLTRPNLQYVVIGDGSAEWAVPVTHINEIIDIPEASIETVDSPDLKHLSGIAHYHGELIPVVNLQELFTSGQ